MSVRLAHGVLVRVCSNLNNLDSVHENVLFFLPESLRGQDVTISRQSVSAGEFDEMKKNIQEIHALLSSPGPKIIHQDEDNRHPMIMPSPYIVPQQPPTIMVPASGRRRSSHLGPVVIHSPTPSITRSRSSSPSRTMVSEPGIFRRTFSRRTALTHRTDATGQELDSVISDFSSIVIIVSLFSLFFVKISFS